MDTHPQASTKLRRPRVSARIWLSTVPTLAIVSTLAVAGVASADGDVGGLVPRAERMLGAGDWQTHGRNKLANQHWNLDLRRGPGNTLEGTVDLTGSPLATRGIVKAKLQGVIVDGTITGEDGELVATIHGYLTKLGCEGTYTDRTGETGKWEWQGQLPE